MEVFPLGHQPLSGSLCRVIGIVKSSAQQLAKHEHLLILLQLPEMVVHGLNAIPNMLEGLVVVRQRRGKAMHIFWSKRNLCSFS